MAYREKKYHTFHLCRKGKQAIATIPGLKAALFKGFKINLAIYLVLAVSLNLVFHFFVKQPLDALLLARTVGWIQIAGRVFLPLLQIAIGLVLMLFSLRVSLKFMGLWYESMVARVLAYTRGGCAPAESGSLITNLMELFLEIVKEVGITVGLFLLGLIPLLGTVLVFLIASHLMGKTVLEPYVCVLKSFGEKREFAQGKRGFTIALGWTQMLLAVIPLIGWVLLPVSLIYQVIGLAWQEEGERALPTPPETANSVKDQPPTPSQPPEFSGTNSDKQDTSY